MDEKTVYSLLMVIGLAFAGLGIVAIGQATSGGTTTTTTTSSGQTTTTTGQGTTTTTTGQGTTTTTTGQGTTTTTSTTASNTQATTFSASGGSGTVSIDGGSAQALPYVTTLTWGSHSVVCSASSGYTALNPSFTIEQDGTLSSVTCAFAPSGASLESLLVTAQFCSLYTGQCYPLIGDNVAVTNGPSGTTNSQGQVTFEVVGGQTYKVCVLNSGYGTLCGSVAVGTSAASILLKATTSGFSIVPTGDNPLGVGLSTADLFIALGIAFFLMGAAGLALSGEEKEG
jgi:hypothetical protein